MTFKRILCPVDFSRPSHQAMLAALELARESGGSVTLFHAWQTPAMFGASSGPMMPNLLQELAGESEKQLARWKAEADALGPKPSTLLASGAAWDAIVETVLRDPTFDLIVMGTHGHTGLKHALLGSVAEKVVRHAPCPVLVIRPRHS
jgi:nucleotide-binding universal stress UspA family protein